MSLLNEALSRLSAIQSQLLRDSEYPYSLEDLINHLRSARHGRFKSHSLDLSADPPHKRLLSSVSGSVNNKPWDIEHHNTHGDDAKLERAGNRNFINGREILFYKINPASGCRVSGSTLMEFFREMDALGTAMMARWAEDIELGKEVSSSKNPSLRLIPGLRGGMRNHPTCFFGTIYRDADGQAFVRGLSCNTHADAVLWREQFLTLSDLELCSSILVPVLEPERDSPSFVKEVIPSKGADIDGLLAS